MKKKVLNRRSHDEARVPAATGKLIFRADSVTDTDTDTDTGTGTGTDTDVVDPVGHNKKDDWDLATRYRDIQRYGYLEPKVRLEMTEKAIKSVITRAREALGPIQKPYSYRTAPEEEALLLESQGALLDLDIEETLFQNLGARGGIHSDPEKLELVYQVRSEKNHGLLLLIDTSLSMKGEKLALLGVTVAAVCEAVPSEALSILGFDSEIHSIKEFGEEISTEAAVSRVLSIPPGGFTNIELGLKTARARIDATALKQARVILISDGRYTEGKDPTFEASNFRFIYPVKIGKDPGGRAVMRDIADTGQGRFAEIREMHELPKFLLNAVRGWVK